MKMSDCKDGSCKTKKVMFYVKSGFVEEDEDEDD
jgi:hypothetical protein